MKLEKRQLDEREIAIHIIYFTSDETKYMGEVVDKYLSTDPRIKQYRSKMLDELKWFAYACALMAITLRSPDLLTKVFQQILEVSSEIDHHNGGNTSFSKDYFTHAHSMVVKYLQVFSGAMAEDQDNWVARGIVCIADVYSQEVFGGVPKPGTMIDKYTQEIGYHFLGIFTDKFEDFDFTE